MKQLYTRALTFTILLIGILPALGQTTLVYWSFENTAGTAFGTGTFARVSSANQQGGPYFQGSDPLNGCAAPDGSFGQGYGIDNIDGVGRGASFSTSTVGQSNIEIQWDIRFTNAAVNTIRLQYTLNGSSWVNFDMTPCNTVKCQMADVISNGVYVAKSTTSNFRQIKVDLSSVAAITGKPNFKIRLVTANDPTNGNTLTAMNGSLGAGGAWRFDNVYIRSKPSFDAVLSGGGTTCGSPVNSTISANISGGLSPYTLVYSDGTNSTTVSGYTSNATINVSPSATTTYTLVSVIDNCGNPASTSGSAVVTVTPTATGLISTNQTICPGTMAADITLTGLTGSIVRWQKASSNGFTIGLVNYDSNQSTTLTSAEIGTVNTTVYIRAVIQNGACPIQYSNTIQISAQTATWNGTWSTAPSANHAVVFNGNFSSSGNVPGCSCRVNSGNVVFNSGHTLNITNGVTVAGGSLTFENNASLLQTNPSAVNSGAINYRRTTTPIRRYDYTYWSSPVDAQIMANLSPLTLSDKYFWWSPLIYNWATIVAPGLELMQPGRGYIIRGPQTYNITTPATYTGTFNGTPNNGDIPVNITVSGANNLNLVGNPYPSAIDADLFMSDPENTAAIGTGTTLYFWTHNTPITSLQYAFSDYATYNYTGGTGTSGVPGLNSNVPNGYIAAGQGFFVKGQATGTAKFKNSMRVSGNNNQFFRQAPIQKDRFWLDISNDKNAYKQVLLGYIPNATNDFELGYDAPIANGTNPVQLYSLLNAEKLTIQGRALPFQSDDVVPMGYSVTEAGTYRINLSDKQGLFLIQSIYLRDKLTGLDHDFAAGAYEFQTSAGVFDDRFEIHYQQTALSNPDFASSKAIIYQKENRLIVTSPTRIMKTVELFDMTGRRIATSQNPSADAIFEKTAATQPMVVKIQYQDGGTAAEKTVF